MNLFMKRFTRLVTKIRKNVFAPKLLAGLMFLPILMACQPRENASQGFSLPEGDPQAGMLVFTSMGCNTCHSLPSVPQFPVEGEGHVTVKLGGEVRTN